MTTQTLNDLEQKQDFLTLCDTEDEHYVMTHPKDKYTCQKKVFLVSKETLNIAVSVLKGQR